MNNVVGISDRKPFTTGGGSGPEDPMLERRVDTLEADMKEVKSSLSRIEVTLARMDGTLSQLPKASDFTRLSTEIAEVKGKVSNLPTTWTILSVVFTTWGIGSGVLIFALTRLFAK